MATIDAVCPHCKSTGSIPRSKIETRLICPKCRRNFFINAAGHAIPGEPVHAHDHDAHGHRGDTQGKAASGRAAAATDGYGGGAANTWRLPLLVGALLGLTAGAVLTFFAYRPTPEEAARQGDVTAIAQAVARSLAADQLDAVKGVSVPGTEADAERFCKEARPKLDKILKDSAGHPPNVSVVVVDPASGPDEAKVIATYTTNHGATRSEQIEAAAGVVELADLSPVNVTFHWKRIHEGTWRLDGKTTLARSRE